MSCLAGIGVLLLVAAAKCRKKSGTAAGILGIAGAFLIVAGLGAIYLLFAGDVTLPLGDRILPGKSQ